MARTLPVYRRVLPGEVRVLPGEIRYADNGVAPEAAEVTVAGWVAPRDAIRLERLEIAHEWRPASGVACPGAGDPPPGHEVAGDPYPTRGEDGQFGGRAGFAGYAADDPFAGYEEFAAFPLAGRVSRAPRGRVEPGIRGKNVHSLAWHRSDGHG